MKKVSNFKDYASFYNKDTVKKLKSIKKTIKEIAPKSIESISYGIPAFKLNGIPLVYFAAYEKHIGFYPRPSGIKKFTKELSRYKTSKGAIQFPLNEDLPLNLIGKIVRFRVKENLSKK